MKNASVRGVTFLTALLSTALSAAAATISGTLHPPGGSGTLFGPSTLHASGGYTTNTTTGSFSLTVPDGWTGVMVVERLEPMSGNEPGAFQPSYRSYTNLTGAVNNQDFEIWSTLKSIAGVVTNASGAGVMDVLISCSGSGGAALTAPNGSYLVGIGIMGSWTGTVTPSKSNCTFSPVSLTLSSVSSDVSNQNFMATSGGSGDGGGSLNNVTQDEVWTAVSSNGLDFTVQGRVFEHASVPDVVQLTTNCALGAAGDLAMYYVDPQLWPSNGEAIMVTTSHDSGSTWSTPARITLSGRANAGQAVDPSVLQTPNGSLRLYFYSPTVTNGVDPATQSGDHQIYSALSSNGTNFTVESVCYQATLLTDPEVLQIGPSWWMLLSTGPATILATSTNGLSFTLNSSFSCPWGGVPGGVLLPNGNVRVFLINSNGVESAVANTNTFAVTKDAGTRIANDTNKWDLTADPSCIRLQNGTYFMTFKRRPVSGGGSTLQAAFTATPASGVAPLAVTFTDTSTGSVTNEFWSFGDGSVTNRTSGNGSHTYTNAGSFNVSLTVSGTNGQSTVTQSNAVAVTWVALSASQALFSTGGASGSVSVTAGSGYHWTATSSVGWITVTNGASGTGTGTVGYTVSANTGSSRTGTISIGDQTFTVMQAGVSTNEFGHFGADGFGTAPHFGPFAMTGSDYSTLTNYLAQESAEMANAGMTWNRTLQPMSGAFSWDMIEYVQGSYDWAKADAVVQACQTQGIQLLAMVLPFAGWDQTNATSLSYSAPNNTNAFKAFLRNMALRYSGNGGTNSMPGLKPGYGIKYWEISNEPELQFGGPTNPLQVATYVAMHLMACDAIKRADPSAKILNGGATPVYMPGTTNWSLSAQLFWDNALTNSAVSNSIDFLNIHYSCPEPSLPLASYLAYWSKFSKPIWVTEIGTYAGTFSTNYPSQTEQYQANWWLRQSCYGLAHGVDKLFWAAFYSQASDWTSNTAMVNSNHTTKLAYTTQGIMSAKMNSFTSAVEAAYSSTAGRYRFLATNRVEVLWDDSNSTVNVSADFGAAQVRVTDIVGNISTQSSAAVTLSSSPVFVEPISGIAQTLQAAFTAAPTSGGAPLDVTFTDTSTGTITNRFWSFGDGAATAVATTNVTHTFRFPGTNAASLTVSGPLGSCTTSQLIVATSVDSVGDGIPNWWRAQYFGGNGATTNASSCSNGDADSTGQNNFVKYIADLNPTNPASRLAIISFAALTNAIQLEWIGGGNAWQYLEYTPSLAAPHWTALFTNAPPTRVTNSVILSGTSVSTSLFYRIEVHR